MFTTLTTESIHLLTITFNSRNRSNYKTTWDQRANRPDHINLIVLVVSNHWTWSWAVKKLGVAYDSNLVHPHPATIREFYQLDWKHCNNLCVDRRYWSPPDHIREAWAYLIVPTKNHGIFAPLNRLPISALYYLQSKFCWRWTTGKVHLFNYCALIRRQVSWIRYLDTKLEPGKQKTLRWVTNSKFDKVVSIPLGYRSENCLNWVSRFVCK